MSHLNEGSIQEYLDDELDVAAQAVVSAHVESCASCTADLRALNHAGSVTAGALALLDADTVTPVLRARAAISAARREAASPAATAAPVPPAAADAAPLHVGRRRRFAAASAAGFARAAMLLLALAGAGAAAIPGSPVRRALDATISRVAQLFTQEQEPVVVDVPEAPAAVPDVSNEWAAIPPADGRVRVQLHAPEGAVGVTVMLIDGPRANVKTAMEQGEVRFVSGTGRLEVLGLGTGSVVIEIPRTLSSAAIQVGGLVHVYKDGDVLRLSGPAGDGQGSEVRFRIGS